MVKDKVAAHTRFWNGEGPSLALIPASQIPLYDLRDYPRRFHDPAGMWEAEIARARQVVDWPTDGIPTVRPNLGVVFVPAIAGQDYQILDNAMPWPGEPLTAEAIRAALEVELEEAELFELARAFYAIHRDSGESESVAPYLADTQGVFDTAHMLYGEETFFDLADPEKAGFVDELMDISYQLYERISLAMKAIIGEETGAMIHGHGTEQGVYFPNAGARLSEDTATLLSPAMIEQAILPSVQRCIDRFDGVFVHYCGRHEALFDQLAAMPGVKAIDLGNPESYDTQRLLEVCAATDTVLYSRVAAEPGEDWRAYTKRLAGLVRDTGARLILRPLVVPDTREQCREMLDLWHEETAVPAPPPPLVERQCGEA